jgi:hypothetical protein
MIEESGDYLIVRQEFEGWQMAAAKTLPEKQGIVNGTAIEVDRALKALNTNDNKDVREKLVRNFKAKLLEYTKATTDYGMANGIFRENMGIIAKYDELLRNSGIMPEQTKAPEMPIQIKEQAVEA